MVQLDRRGWAICGCSAFDDVRVKCALSKELGTVDLLGFFFETIDERMSYAAAFLLWVTNSCEGIEESFACVDYSQVGFEVIRELRNDGRLLVFSEQTVIDQDARQLRSDGFEDQGCGHG